MNDLDIPDGQRVDRWLWCARFFKSRTLAAKVCAAGKVRINRKAIDKASAVVRVDDELTFPQGRTIRVIKVAAMAHRRGPAAEAQKLYEDLTPRDADRTESALPVPRRAAGHGRPTKRDRRAIERYIREAD